MNYVKQPNLPAREISIAAVSKESKAFEALSAMGLAVIPVFSTPDLSGATASHADLQLFHAGGNRVFAASCSDDTTSMLRALGFDVRETEKRLSDEYPGDCALNSLVTGDRIFGNPKAQDPLITMLAKETGREAVPVKQGYVRCSCAVVGSGAFITADEGIAAAAGERGIDVLKIRPGYIELAGYDTGFIGGCCGLAAPDLLLTAGSIAEHPDYENIRAFALNYGVYIEPLWRGSLTDIGGILPLAEK